MLLVCSLSTRSCRAAKTVHEILSADPYLRTKRVQFQKLKACRYPDLDQQEFSCCLNPDLAGSRSAYLDPNVRDCDPDTDIQDLDSEWDNWDWVHLFSLYSAAGGMRCDQES